MSVDLLDVFTHMEEAHWEYVDAGYRHDVSFHDEQESSDCRL